jgi:hypothetical protein
VEPGATVALRPGELVEIHAPLDPLDAQYFVDAVVTGDPLPSFATGYELMSSSWLFSADVVWTPVAPQVTQWLAPEGARGPIFAYYLLSDQRSIVWAWLRFEVAAP